MQLSEKVSENLQKIHMLKEIPSLPVIAQEILRVADNADIAELSCVIEKDPGLSARLISLANSAYFGWPGGVRTIYDAIYKVLGLKLVKGLSMGIVLNKLLETRYCTGFRPEQYWFSSFSTAIMTQSLFSQLSPSIKNEIETVYLNGLLHNLGIAILVHLFPSEMTGVFSKTNERHDCSVSTCVRSVLGIDQHQAGGWLARRWGLPLDIVIVMEHHKEPEYRQDYWPIVQLVGYCKRQSENLLLGNETFTETSLLTSLGISDAGISTTRLALDRQMEDIKALASQMAKGEE